jgi:transposase InsO family protein
VTPTRRRSVVHFFRSGYQVSEQRACRVAAVPRTTMRYRSQARDQSPLRQRIKELAATRVRYGYRRIPILFHREGWRVNAKRVYRLYREQGLSLRLKRPKKRVSVPRVTPPPAVRPNEGWSIAFLRGSLADGRAYRNGVTLEFSRPGKPTDNAFVESFNGHFRQECLDPHGFASREEARQIIEAWRIEYNTERPHQALKYGTPTAFAAAWEVSKEVADERIGWTNSGFRSILSRWR